MNKLSNPYNSFGQAHNDGLDYVGNNLPASPTIQDFISLTSTYTLSLQYGKTGSQQDLMAMQVFIASVFNGGNCLDSLIQSGSFSQKQLDIINILLNPPPTIPNADLPNFYLTTGYNIITSNIPAEEKKILLLGAAIGNYSTTYWLAQLSNPNSPWTSYIGDASKLPAWAKGDIGGAIGGGIGGFLYCWWTGAGAVAGTVCGAIGGAISGSLGAL
jgi:hypothetical protein